MMLAECASVDWDVLSVCVGPFSAVYYIWENKNVPAKAPVRFPSTVGNLVCSELVKGRVDLLLQISQQPWLHTSEHSAHQAQLCRCLSGFW